MKELKSQVEILTIKLQSKYNEPSSNKQRCTSSGSKDNSFSKTYTSTKDATKSCQELYKNGHYSNGIYQVPHPTEIKKLRTSRANLEEPMILKLDELILLFIVIAILIK